MSHVVLLGDSVFDNAAYVPDGPDVITHLQRRVPADWRASLLAVDGGVMADIPSQLARLPADATHLVVSIGGNDALGRASILDAPSRSVADTLLQLADIRRRFQRQYAEMLDAVLLRGLATTICTIYDPRYPNPVERQVGTTALMVLNDAIIREAALRGVAILDLRLVCNEDGDFANPIEPSAQGGAKIAAAIASLVSTHDFAVGRSAIYTR